MQRRAQRLLDGAFAAVLLGRFAYPFVQSPMDRIIAIADRQWNQAEQFLNPGFMGGVDTFLYQAWLFAWRSVGNDAAWLMNLSAGLLCAVFALAWFGVCRQLLPMRWAYVLAFIIALHPSFLTIYSYFTNETLLLPLMGAAVYASIRAVQRQDSHWFVAACVLWALATITRLIALPFGLACVVMMLLSLRIRWRAGVLALIVVSGVLHAAASHSQRAIGVYTPLGMPHMNAMLARSHASRIYIHVPSLNNPLWFRSPSHAMAPLAPLSSWQVNDLGPPINIVIDPVKGRHDWDREMRRFPLTPDTLRRQLQLNALYFFFVPSWPEVWPITWDQRYTKQPERMVHEALRWQWLPLTLLVFALAWRLRGDGPQRWVVWMVMGGVTLCLLQTTAVFEGRYRKPIEPFILISAGLVLAEPRKRSAQSR